MDAQVTIHNTVTSKGGIAEKVLSIKASKLLGYIDSILAECKDRGKFEKLPLLKVIDSFDTKEEFLFEKKLPNESVFSSKGRAVLIILPEDSSVDSGVNLFTTAKQTHAANEKVDGGYNEE